MSHLDASFGVEIECYLPDGASQHACAAAVNQRLGSLGSCAVESYNHQRRNNWKIVADGSLQDYTRGIELVSPVLFGEQGLRQIEVVCKALQDFGCTVSRRCGLHVHVGVGSDMQISFFKNIVKLYSIYEPVIDSIMPMSRRGSSNSYCRPMTSARPGAVDAAASFDAVVVATTNMRHREDSRRYFKLNLDAYSRHKTVEFRQHSGTLDAAKASRWTVLCLRMVAAAKGQLALGTSASVNKARPGSKAHKIGEMLLRVEGVTGREICTEMGWPSVSIPAQAKAAGLEVTSQRMGREVRYWAVNAHASSPSTPITIDGFAQIIGASEDEKAYLHQRAADLSGSVQWAG